MALRHKKFFDALLPPEENLEELIDVQPLHDLIFIDPFRFKDTVGESNIVMPEMVKDEYPLLGRVFAIGPGWRLDICDSCKENGKSIYRKSELKVGDYVIYPTWGPKPYQVQGRDGKIHSFIVARDGDVLAKVQYS